MSNETPSHKTLFESSKDDLDCALSAYCILKKSKTKVISNISMLSPQQLMDPNLNYFLLDEAAKDKFREDPERNESCLVRFEEFAQRYESSLYIRYFDDRRISGVIKYFADDIFQLLSMEVERSGGEIDEATLQNYRKKIYNADESSYVTIDEKMAERLFAEFGMIEIRSIFEVPDPIYYTTRVIFLENGTTPIRTRAPNGKIVVDPLQAAYHIFSSLVTQKDTCCKLECRLSYQKAVTDVLEGYRTMNQTVFILIDRVNSQIKDLSKLMCNECQSTTPFNPLSDMKAKEFLSFEKYEQICKEYGLPIYLKQGEIVVWVARIYFLAGWFQVSFINDNVKLKEYLRQILLIHADPKLSGNEILFQLLYHVTYSTQPPSPTLAKKINDLSERKLFGSSNEPKKGKVSLQEFRKWIDEAEKQWQLDGSGCDPEETLFPEMS